MTFTVPIKIVSSSGDGKLAFDDKGESSWKASGKGQSLEVFFDKTTNIDKINVKFGAKDQVYDIFYKDTINDYQLFQQISSADGKEYQVFDVDEFKNIVSLKIVGQNDENEIVDIQLVTDDCNCCKEICECEPVPVPPKDDPGRVKDWGSLEKNDNTNWKAVNMSNPKTMFKVVDSKGVNIADMFHTKAGAEKHIKDFKPTVDPKPDPKPDPDPNPGPVTPPSGYNVSPIGKVKIPYAITGKVSTEYRNNDRDDGKRMDFTKLVKGTYVNSAVLGYFAFPKGKAPKDEVSGKWSVEGHSDGTDPKCYDLGIEIYGGSARWRFESPHPKYTSNLGKEKEKGVTLDDKFVGYMFIRRNLPDGKVALEIWQDAGNNEGEQVSNQWKQLAYWEDAKYKITNYPKGPQVTIRIDGSNVVKDLKLKHVQCVELK
jgi:hypothetical protein